jgi:uncharacterized protein (DUF1501 family)
MEHFDSADPRHCACQEGREAGRLTRRTLLAGVGAVGLAGGLAKMFGDDTAARYAFAGAGYDGDTVVVISLRGGFDGLSAIAPLGDPNYATARPTIAIPQARALVADSMFGFHPALAPLKSLFDRGQLGVVHAVGQTNPTRSHFLAMEQMESSAPGTDLRTGWLDRMIGLTGADVFSSLALGTTTAPSSMRGPTPELAMKGVGTFSLQGASASSELARWSTALTALHASAPGSVKSPATTALNALATVAPIKATTYVPANGAKYPATDFGRALTDLAQLIKSGVGVRAATIDVGDWDMHVGLGSSTAGWMFDKLTELALGISAFVTDLGPKMNDVTMVTLSEFGRRVAENESGGLDHGLGNACFVVGGGVAGGKIYGTWPSLKPEALLSGDLAGTTDYRTVLAEILEKRAKLSVAEVFPGLSSSRLGLVRQRA